MYEGSVPINHVSTFDVGRAAVAISSDTKKWHTKTLSCIASIDTGEELAVKLAKVDASPVRYQAAPPIFILWLFLPHLYNMVKQRKDMARMEDWSKEMEEFKEVVPDAMNFERWLVERQNYIRMES